MSLVLFNIYVEQGKVLATITDPPPDSVFIGSVECETTDLVELLEWMQGAADAIVIELSKKANNLPDPRKVN